jgi:ubiquitin-activating enzyme E1
MSNPTNKIDEALYSRQLLALGRDAMNKMTRSSVLISCAGNFSGLGVEVAKCIILAGVNRVAIHSVTDILTYKDLGSNYYTQNEDVGNPVFQKTIKSLESLNSNVLVDIEKYLTVKTVMNYQCIVFCDYNVHTLLFWNRICRQHNIKFIMLQTYGLAGNIFCDFGDQYIVDDIDGETLKTGIIIKINNNRLSTSEPHKLYSGDIVELEENSKYLVRAYSATEFELREFKEDYRNYSSEQLQMKAMGSPVLGIPDQVPQNMMFRQIKLPTTIRFKSLEESLLDPEYVMFDTVIWDMPKILNIFMKALSMWRIDNRCVFDDQTHVKDVWETFPISDDDYRSLQRYISQEIRFSRPKNKFVVSDHIDQIFKKLAMTCMGRICGVDAVLGAMGAQEVIKAVSNKFTPTRQFLHFEALNILPDNYVQYRTENPCMFEPRNDRYDAQTVIFGRDYVDCLRKKNAFVVGAGAIGCEHIKNFSMMGLNQITITDMDHIENSNLNRQFLFRREDIGQPKSVTVAKKAKQINPETHVIAHENKVGKETIKVYDWKFFDKIDVVASALDNVDARLFVDSLCVRYSKPLLESGTLGTQGSVQSIIPYLTESYGSLQDPPEQSIAVCTLKLFPYKFEHVVQYARDLFEGFFNRIPLNLIKVRDTPDHLNQMTPTDLMTMYEDMVTITKGCKNFKYCINLAYKQWHILFRDVINQLISKYPEDHKDEDHILFWSGNKMFPQQFCFNTEDQTHMDFIVYFSHVWADMIGIPVDKRYSVEKRERYKKFLARLNPPPEVVCKDVSQNPATNKKPVKDSLDSDPEKLISKIKGLVSTNTDSLTNVKAIDFEKDDDSNHHIDFVTAFANIRALNYRIEPRDRLATKGIAGKIIPAIATTTSVVSGLVALEMYKVFYDDMLKTTDEHKSYNSLQRFRYGSFNLAVQSFGFSESNPPKHILINGKHHDIWTKHAVDPDQTLGEFIDEWNDIGVERIVDGKKQSNIMGIDFIAADTGIIYSNMMDVMDTDDSNDNIRHKTFRNLISDMNKEIEGDHYLTLSLEEIDPDDCQEFDSNQNTDTMISIRVSLRD